MNQGLQNWDMILRIRRSAHSQKQSIMKEKTDTVWKREATINNIGKNTFKVACKCEGDSG